MHETIPVDVLVIGGGVAGAVAAARASALGSKVVVLAPAGGASALSSGAIDVADSLAAEPWANAMQDIARENPWHPYARVGEAGRVHMRAALSLLQDVAKGVSLCMREDGHNHLLATQFGTVKRCAMVQKSALLDLGELWSDAVVGVVGVSGLLGFSAKSVAQMLRFSLAPGEEAPFHVMPLEVDFAPSPGSLWRSPLEASAALDDPLVVQSFAKSLSEAITACGRSPTHLLLPAFLSRQNAMGVIGILEQETGCIVRELLATPHSVPGLRLASALQAGLKALGIETCSAKVESFELEAHKIVGVKAGGIFYIPKTVVLATGKYLGGGISNHTGQLREQVFGLPIWEKDRVVTEAFVGDLTAGGPAEAQPLFSAGLVYDEQLRPYNAYKELFALNLFAAGAVLGGFEPAKDATALGVSVLTGYLAGGYAKRSLQG